MQTKLEDIIGNPNYNSNKSFNRKIDKILEVIDEIQKISASNENSSIKAEALLFRLINLGELFNDLRKAMQQNGNIPFAPEDANFLKNLFLKNLVQ